MAHGVSHLYDALNRSTLRNNFNNLFSLSLIDSIPRRGLCAGIDAKKGRDGASAARHGVALAKKNGHRSVANSIIYVLLAETVGFSAGHGRGTEAPTLYELSIYRANAGIQKQPYSLFNPATSSPKLTGSDRSSSAYRPMYARRNSNIA